MAIPTTSFQGHAPGVASTKVDNLPAQQHGSKGSPLGAIAGLGLGIGTGNWAPFLGSVLGGGAAGAVNSAISGGQPTSGGGSSNSSSSTDSSTSSGSGNTPATTAATTAPSTSEVQANTVHQNAANLLAQSLLGSNSPTLASLLIDPTTGQLHGQSMGAVLAMLAGQNAATQQQPQQNVLQQQFDPLAPSGALLNQPNSPSGNLLTAPQFQGTAPGVVQGG